MFRPGDVPKACSREQGARLTTEAELQARLEARIRAALPLLPAQIKLEHHLHLRLGHHAVVIDGSKSDRDGVRGRYDVLVLAEGRPLLLAELKAPTVAVGDADVRQALSYARLHEPVVPLVLVTNGASTVLLRTYDGAELEPSDIATDRLTSVLGAAAALAASASENAIRTLLGASRDTWAQLLASWSEEALEAITGSVTDFRSPLARELTLPRVVVKELKARLDDGTRVLILYGLPLSGVTNVLAQLCRARSGGLILFIDGRTVPDVLQFMANRLTRELSFGVSKDDLRAWLNTGRGTIDMTLVIDGLPRDGVDELVESARAGLLRLVIGMDSEAYRRCSVIAGRGQSSLVGRASVALELLPLSDEEFHAALETIGKSFGASFFNGAQHTPELRWPRTLRVVAATLPQREAAPVRGDRRETRLMLPPIPGLMTLELCSRAFASEPVLKFDLQKLAGAFLADAAQHVADPGWLAATWGRPSIDPDLLERALGGARLERLRDHGFVSWIDTQVFGPRVLVRVEELLAHHVAEEWSSGLSDLGGRESVTTELDRLLRVSPTVPAGEVALAAAIFRAAQKNPTVLGVAIPHLMQHEPTTSRLTDGARIDLLVKDGPIRLHFGKGVDERAVGDLQPWVVLSHLSSWPMAVEGCEVTGNFSIFAKLGASSHFLYLPKPTELARVRGLHFHEIDGIGSVPCLATGIVEPLLQAMLGHAHTYPDELVALARMAMHEKEVHLAWRVLTVAIASQTSTDEAVESAANGVEKALGRWWGNALKQAFEHAGNAEDRPWSASGPPKKRETSRLTSRRGRQRRRRG